jgi:hypothetical protein
MSVTRQERMLTNYNNYTQQWEDNNRYLSEVRSSLNNLSRDNNVLNESIYTSLDTGQLEKVAIKNIVDKTFK